VNAKTSTRRHTRPADGQIIGVKGVSKRYGTVQAVDNVDLSIGTAEILAVVGDNGAGKSTLVKMFSGAVVPDSGSIFIGDRTIHIRDPIESRRLGIETIYQDLALLPNRDVVTNLFLGREEFRGGAARFLRVLARRRMRENADRQLADLRISIPRISGVPVGLLSGGQRQSVAIARAMAWASKLVIMDEPTAALGVAQSRAVLDLVQRVRERGTSVVIVSHILPHVLELADRIIVMRHGRKVADLEAKGVTQDRLVQLIVGYEAGTIDHGARTTETTVDLTTGVSRPSNAEEDDATV
jgi:simple sugar transport system ATP-binding protein